ncbi:MAG: phosphoribosylformylglycinamidine cyclo-ligase, partial [bacterium]
KNPGVDIDAGNKLVEKIKKMAPGIGGFSGLFPLPKGTSSEYLLAASTDGVGTKLKIAQLVNKHNTIGIDLVAMSVNDIITIGAKPLIFLDYFATGKLNVNLAEQVIKGIVEGCRQSDCILLGGETAEMPGFYKPGEYDLAGFCVGTVKKSAVIDGSKIKPGDAVIGLASSGPHSNGYSLIRKVFTSGELKKYRNELLKPTRIYVRDILNALKLVPKAIKGMAHITGGGFLDNIPRILPDNCQVVIDKNSWTTPKIFKLIRERAKLDEFEMFRTLNMGIGMVLVVEADKANKIIKCLPGAKKIGVIVKGKKEVVLI